MNREFLMDIFNAGLSAVDPYQSVMKTLRIEDDKLHAAGSAYGIKNFNRFMVLGAGKASVRMAAAVEHVLGDLLTAGLVTAPYGQESKLQKVETAQAAHPLPDAAGVAATKQLLDLAGKANEKTLAICLLSGGGSALLVAPVPAITLEEKQRTTELFLKSGCSIAELNTVRKHLSTVKGGGLAKALHPASIVSLILSDVVGDSMDVIASGPTAPDSSTFAEAIRVVEKYKLKKHLPSPVVSYLERGLAGKEPETAKSSDVCFVKTRNVIVAGLTQALAAARSRAKALGYNSVVVSTELQGAASGAGRALAKTALQSRNELKPGERLCLLCGGETTVNVNGTGRGGRNQELALAFAMEISGASGISMISAGTDGRDGPTDAAGAVVDGTTVETARQCGIRPEAYLENNDSYTFFQKIDLVSQTKHHVITGQTGTNVMDLQIILLEG